MHSTIKTGESISKHSQPNHIVNTNYSKEQFSKLKIHHISQKPIEFNTKNLKLAKKKKPNLKSQNFPQILEVRWVGGRGGQREQRLGKQERRLGM